MRLQVLTSLVIILPLRRLFFWRFMFLTIKGEPINTDNISSFMPLQFPGREYSIMVITNTGYRYGLKGFQFETEQEAQDEINKLMIAINNTNHKLKYPQFIVYTKDSSNSNPN